MSVKHPEIIIAPGAACHAMLFQRKINELISIFRPAELKPEPEPDPQKN